MFGSVAADQSIKSPLGMNQGAGTKEALEESRLRYKPEKE